MVDDFRLYCALIYNNSNNIKFIFQHCPYSRVGLRNIHNFVCLCKLKKIAFSLLAHAFLLSKQMCDVIDVIAIDNIDIYMIR